MSQPRDERVPTRKSLIDAVKVGQRWEEFDNFYRPLIYGYARKEGLSHAEAEDAAQETMASVWKNISKYDRAKGRFKSWLLKVTRWRIIDQLRERGPLVQLPPWADETEVSTGTGPEVVQPAAQEFDAGWDAEWEKNLLEGALRKVRPRVDPQKYQIFDFYVNKDWPAEKVAACFGVSVEQVYQAKHRITEMIRAEVKRIEKEMF